MQLISGALKTYAWGIPGGLQPWLAESNSHNANDPQAELWFGVHPSGASKIIGSDLTLDTLLERTDVPILVKILAAAKPLSIQVHPHRGFALEGFNELNDTQEFANAFADSYEKTELLYALTPFTAFCGWRPLEQLTKILEALPIELPVQAFATDVPDRRALFEYFVNTEFPIEVTRAIPEAVGTAGLSEFEIDAYKTVIADYPGDQGALLAVFLQPLALAPGESVFIPAGIPHSYIAGTGIEVMTSSDNVLRLGLTPKPVYKELALRALNFEASLPQPSEAPFIIDVLRANTHSQESPSQESPSGEFRLVLGLEGQTNLDSITIESGQAAVITASEPTISVSTSGVCAIVSTRP
jgi:mannose-6-phosphate isomerase